MIMIDNETLSSFSLCAEIVEHSDVARLFQLEGGEEFRLVQKFDEEKT